MSSNRNNEVSPASSLGRSRAWRVAVCALWMLVVPLAAVAEKAPEWAIAIHGGAGTIPKDMNPALVEAYRASLRRGLELGIDLLKKEGSGLEAAVAVVRFFEDDSLFNAGVGAVYTHDGSHELDAAVMDGRTLGCGAVAGVRTVRNPILLARLVMEKSKHVFLAGPGAEAFARAQGMEPVDPKIFDTQRRREQLQKALADDKFGTVGCVVLDREGHLAAATSTGGLTNKRWGRVGDTPVIGAGTYANDRSCAISCTGQGEQFIRHTVARDVAALVEYKGLSLREAAIEVVQTKLKRGDGGLIGVSRTGEIALVFNSDGMYRGAADASGRFEIAIWEK
jgi:beta-aspartyl-peptidase (threonine type)